MRVFRFAILFNCAWMATTMGPYFIVLSRLSWCKEVIRLELEQASIEEKKNSASSVVDSSVGPPCSNLWTYLGIGWFVGVLVGFASRVLYVLIATCVVLFLAICALYPLVHVRIPCHP